MFNFSENDFEIKKGDRIAQLIIEAISMCDLDIVENLDETLRGDGGFGSTGVSLDNKENKENKENINLNNSNKKNNNYVPKTEDEVKI